MSNSTVDAIGDLNYSDGGILSALTVNVVVAIFLLLLFSLLQTLKSFKPVFSPRAIPGNFATNMALPETKTLPNPPSKCCGWFLAAYKVTDDEILARSGIRSLLFLRFQQTAIKLLAVVTVLSLIVLLPINLSGEHNRNLAMQQQVQYESGFYDWTTNNMSIDDSRLWVHFIVLTVVSCVAYFLIFRAVEDFHQIRRVYLSRVHNSESVVKKTVFIANIPKELRDPRILIDHIHRTSFPDSVLQVAINLDVPQLQSLFQRRKILRDLLRNVSSRQTERGETVQIKVGAATRVCQALCCDATCCCGVTTLAADYYKDQLELINKQMYDERKREDHPTTGHAFVTFAEDQTAKLFVQNQSLKFEDTTIAYDPSKYNTTNTVYFRNKARGALHKAVQNWKTKLTEQQPSSAFPPTHWKVKSAPVPGDLMWENFAMSDQERTFRKIIYFTAKWLLVIFWSALISALANAGSLFVADIGLPGWAFGVVSSYLPSLIAILLQALLPYLLQYMLEMTGVLTRSEVHLTVMEDFFTFAVVSTLVLPTILIANFETFYARIFYYYDSPFTKVLETLSKITSPTTTFYIAYVLQNALMGTCLALLRVLPLFVRFLARRFAVTKQDFMWADAISNWPCFFYQVYGEGLLLLTITLFFSLTMPIITPFGLIYFLCKYHVERYLVCFVYPTPLDTGKGGDMYASALRRCCLIVACFQLAMCATFVGKACVPQAILSVLQVGLSVYLFTVVRDRLHRAFKADLWVADLGDEYNRMSKIPREQMLAMYQDAYRHPAFSTREDLLTHLAMLDNDPEAAVMTEDGTITFERRSEVAPAATEVVEAKEEQDLQLRIQ